MKLIITFILSFYFLSGFCQETYPRIKVSEDLEIVQLSQNVLLHVSYVSNPQFGRFGSNGMIYMNNDEAMFMDTPMTEELTQELLSWFHITYPETKIVGIVVNHFHDDCLGGLRLFHEAGIKSYSHQLTPSLSASDTIPKPGIVFEKELTLMIGGKKLTCYYFGEAHTKDNIVTWIPDEKILFGGCMVKAMNSAKGNLADANTKMWASTVSKVKKTFNDVRIVIPGHGEIGGKELLDYTIALFSDKKNRKN